MPGENRSVSTFKEKDMPTEESPIEGSNQESKEEEEQVTLPKSMMDQLIAQLEAANENLAAVRAEGAARMADMESQLDALRSDMDRGLPELGPAPEELDETKRYIRIKPYNKKRGYLRKRQFCRELNIVCVGGTGYPGDIPQWYEVDEGQAESIKRYRQNDNDLDSPKVYDVVTAAKRREIDTAEEGWRRNQIGISARPDVVARQTEAQVRSQTKADTVRNSPRIPEPEVEQPPSLVEGAGEFKKGAPRRVHGADRRSAVMDLDGDLPEGMDTAVALAEANPMSRGPVGD